MTDSLTLNRSLMEKPEKDSLQSLKIICGKARMTIGLDLRSRISS
jgi:hypothetical protein